MMTAYYNEIDPFCVKWLRNLIAAGHIAPGEVDERSIVDVRSDDLRGFTQCHFFAGIGGWSYALRLAGWPDDRPVWTGSCPCQPFSAAGSQRGHEDERHLWPAWFRLIRECRPATVFGEQVEAAIKHGWLRLVQTDLEGIGYACGAVAIPAASVGAPHQRARLWFVADSAECGRTRQGRSGATQEFGIAELRASNPWRDLEWLACSDGKARPTQPGLFPLAHGIPGRVGRLRAYGNAIVPQVAAEFIGAVMDCRP